MFPFEVSKLYNIHLVKKVKDLSLYESQLDISFLGEVLQDMFYQNRQLPGVILTQNDQLCGLISRRQFAEKMMWGLGIPLYAKRPLSYLYKNLKTDYLTVSEETPVVEAAAKALSLPHNLIGEPLIVEDAQQSYKLLDFNDLLVAQSEIHAVTYQTLIELYEELADRNQDLTQQAHLDALTHLANRRHFNDRLQQEWRRMSREQKWISLIMCDVDYFKKYNDTYGHQAGDECLRTVAQAVKHSVKRPGDVAARYGGEEFAVILPDTRLNGAVCVAQEIRQKVISLKLPHESSQVSSHVTLSMGVASLRPSCSRSPEMLVKMADQALYLAKEGGRDRILTYPFSRISFAML